MSSPHEEQGASEFGGWPGVVQPAPHDIADVPYEQLNFSVQTDPSDPAANAGTVAEAHRKRGKDRLNG